MHALININHHCSKVRPEQILNGKLLQLAIGWGLIQFLYMSENRAVREEIIYVRCKGKASSLDIAPLKILDSGALQPRKWKLIGTGCSTAAHASGCPLLALTDFGPAVMYPTGILINHAGPSPRNPCT